MGALLLSHGCKPKVETPDSFAGPLPVEKDQALPVLIHYMPWFETESHDGHWGIHWTMATANPNQTDPSGLPDIAAHDHPLIGPYSSFDPDVLEYHALLMKYCGADAAVIDWYGTHEVLDYGTLNDATEAFIEALKSVGLEYALMYEDRTLENVGLPPIQAAVQDWTHLNERHFTDTAYFRSGPEDAPWVGVFGPVTLEEPDAWSTVLDAAESSAPRFFTLWGESADAGPAAAGEFAWIWAGNGTDPIAAVETFSADPQLPVVGVAFPGFEDYYLEGGWGEGLGWSIDPAEGQTFRELLDLADSHSEALEALQIATWNDFGEGTMIEPTIEDGFDRLLDLQAFTGVPFGAAALETIHELFLHRKSFAGNETIQAQLDEVRHRLLRLDPEGAAILLNGI